MKLQTADQAAAEFWQKVAWDGVVEVFRLAGHPKAKRCYAWSYTEGKETRFVTVLEIPPVESAQTAVRAAIASEAKNNRFQIRTPPEIDPDSRKRKHKVTRALEEMLRWPIEGVFQIRSNVIHIRAKKIERLPTFMLEASDSHDFH